MRKGIYIFILMLIGGISWWIFSDNYDSNKATKFYRIASDGNEKGVHEIFVVHNAPYDTSEIRKVIEKFNLEAWTMDSIKRYGVCGRTFYRETKYMTRKFKEGEEYNPVFSSWDNIQDFRNHEDDMLMTMSYYLDEVSGHIGYSYWLNWDYDHKKDDKFSNEVSITFSDLKSFLKYRQQKLSNYKQ